jgi:hypothetical protein
MPARVVVVPFRDMHDEDQAQYHRRRGAAACGTKVKSAAVFDKSLHTRSRSIALKRLRALEQFAASAGATP